MNVFARIISLGNVQPEAIQCVALNHDGVGVFAAYKNVIKLFVRAVEKSTFLGHEGEVHTLLPFGDHLLSIDSENCLKIWDVREKGKPAEAPAGYILIYKSNRAIRGGPLRSSDVSSDLCGPPEYVSEQSAPWQSAGSYAAVECPHQRHDLCLQGVGIYCDDDSAVHRG